MKLLLSRLERVIWTAVLGAVWNVILCSLVDLLTWHLRYYSLPVGVVWTVSMEAMLWRGALVGAVVGWWLGVNRTIVLASAGGGLLLALLKTLETVAEGTHLRYAIEIRVIAHFIINGLLTGTVAGLLARRALRSSAKQEMEV